MKTPVPLNIHFNFYPLLNIEGERAPLADEVLCRAIARLRSCASDPDHLCDWVHAVQFKFEDLPQRGLTSRGLIRLNPKGLTEWTVVHELAHAWDASTGWTLSERMRRSTRSRFPCLWLHKRFPDDPRFWYRAGNPPPPCGIDKHFNAKEDFAESVAAYLFPEKARQKARQRNAAYESFGFVHFHDTPRGEFIKKLFQQEKSPS